MSDATGRTPPQPLPEPTSGLPELLDRLRDGFARVRQAPRPGWRCREIGRITAVSPGVVTVAGLPHVRLEELIRFQNGIPGIAFHLGETEVGCLVLGPIPSLSAGDEVRRTGAVFDVPVGEGLLGRVLDPTGRPLDGGGPLASSGRRPLEREAPPIMDRLPVTVPMQTGIKVIDALIPIGRGQRELIVGDRQTGKSTIALAAIVNQRHTGVLCLYCAIGQRGASVAKALAALREAGAMAHTIAVVAEADSGPGMQYIAPYAATAIGEFFMDHGRDVLIVYDDLGSHARAYRELTLLLRRPPGREAFPGDVFSIHARLLERATHLRRERGGGSLTALPIVETEAQNISGYIPTNLISITDGQISLSPGLFQKGMLPAVDVGKSVSRVGGKAQLPAYQAVSGPLKLFYSQFEELEVFARFGTRLDDNTRKIIAHGRRIRHCLAQGPSDLLPVEEQIAVLLALTEGLFDPVPEDRLDMAERAVRRSTDEWPATARDTILGGAPLGPKDRELILGLARQVALRPDFGALEPRVPQGSPGQALGKAKKPA